jgi:hypothetical protein
LALPHALQALLGQYVGGFNGRILPAHGGQYLLVARQIRGGAAE